jgi:hypothetical protein
LLTLYPATPCFDPFPSPGGPPPINHFPKNHIPGSASREPNAHFGCLAVFKQMAGWVGEWVEGRQEGRKEGRKEERVGE